MLNSPYYHMYLLDIDNAYFHDFEIEVDIFGQLNLDQFFMGTAGLGLKVPTFPLNTDGIDPLGSNILIGRVNITNFDDAIAVKPCNKGCGIAQNHCAENVLVKDVNVWW